MSNTATALPAAQQSGVIQVQRPQRIAYKPQGLASDFDMDEAEDFLDLMESIRAKDIKNAELASINMVPKYLKFNKLENKPQRLFFFGIRARPLIDYKSKEPLIDEHGQQIYGPAVVLYDEDTNSMFVNQAAQLTKTIMEMPGLKRGDMLEIIYKGIEQTSTGNNMQTFEVYLLK